MRQKSTAKIYKEAETLVTNDFNQGYFKLHNHLCNTGERENSRNGETVEILNFKTIINNPYNRCVGGFDRNINIFFLLAEAMWIWTGKRDVKFLDIFNKKMKDYSDDGNYFHAPYGFRLRNYGIDSMTNLNDSNKHYFHSGTDQILHAIDMLSKNSQDRRVVLSIWDCNLDLNKSSKDLPCNDLIMLKVRKGKLHTTIQNRSNDLDWGLSTNVFQFSFVSELIANCLDIKLGTQVHNSQSLHLYFDNPLTRILEENTEFRVNMEGYYLYGNHLGDDFKNVNKHMDFNFNKGSDLGISTTPLQKLEDIDWWLNSIISKLTIVVNNGMEDKDMLSFKKELKEFSNYFYHVFFLLEIFINYKNKQYDKKSAVLKILEDIDDDFKYSDIVILSLNFFISRMDVIPIEIQNIIKSNQYYVNLGKY